ncbi:MAG TPA: ATP-binding protein, partial [Propionibacteriaceae bacterium]|nr:ATP-binding protein [Propionibacteriaceae bacterium]
YGEWSRGQEPAPETVRAALVEEAQRIEADRGVAIEVVGVGDAPLTDDTVALVAAAREAMLNAAKHSGCDQVDVYAEVDDGAIEVFVRDRGVGFELGDVHTDRLGVRRSIIDRMERHGGTARIRSSPGEGTEIALSMRMGA